jgi:hypothetical protein
MTTRLTAAVSLLLLFAIGCAKPAPPVASATAGSIEIANAFAYAPVTPEAGAAYFSLHNAGSTPDTLVSVSTPIAPKAGIHGTMGNSGGGMTPLGVVPIPPGATVELKPGGMHLMFENMSDMPKAGSRLSLTLTFSAAGAVTFDVPVRAYGQ